MNTFSYSAGAGAIIIALIIRLSFLAKIYSTKSKSDPIEARSISGLITLLIVMGIMWILLGVLLSLTKDWLESSIWGIIAQLLLILSPLLLFRAKLWWFSHKEQKNE
jgi:phosphatidylglycerophosphate synthase